MSKKTKTASIIAVIILLVVGAGFFVGRGRYFNIGEKPIETYIGGACTCPDKPGRIVNLYKHNGDSIENIKRDDANTACSPLEGCSLPTEYRLYP